MKNQKGQIIVFVLLITGIALTVGLAGAKRITTETKINKDDELLNRAFNAAESGIDYYIATGQSTYVASDGSVADISAVSVGGTGVTEIDLGGVVERDRTSYFWLVGHNDDGSINYSNRYSGSDVTICLDVGFTGAVKVDYFYQSSGSFMVVKNIYNIAGATQIVNDGQSVVLGSCSGHVEYGSITYNVTGDPVLIAITPLFESSRILLQGSADFPVQGIEYISVGRAGNVSENVNTKREIRVKRMWGTGILDFLVDGVVAVGRIDNN